MSKGRKGWLALWAVVVLMLPAVAFAHAGHGDPRDGKVATLAGGTLPPAATQPIGPHPCVDGKAAIFPCDKVDLLSFTPHSVIAGGGNGNMLWGWVDPLTAREYVLYGSSTGLSFVDVTDPSAPELIGTLPSHSFQVWALWRDVRVYQGYAFVISEYDAHGMQVFDLSRLRNVTLKPAIFTADAHYPLVSNTHSLWINEATGYAYLSGTNTCSGGLHMVDVRDQLNPSYAGCYAGDGYTHESECLIYKGPDSRYRGHEICMAANEDTVTIVDVTDKANPVQLSRTGYPTAAYTHQGAFTPDHKWWIFNDEIDEEGGTVETMTTYIMEVPLLTAPKAPLLYDHGINSIDHNLYIHGSYIYQSNYTSGFKVLSYDKKSLAAGKLTPEAYFDVFPAADIDQYGGTWGNYKFPSGNVAVSTIESGLFMLKPNLGATKPGKGPQR